VCRINQISPTRLFESTVSNRSRHYYEPKKIHEPILMHYKNVIPGRKGVLGLLSRSSAKSLIPGRLRPIGYLNHLTKKKTDKRVMNGPFRGMRYVDDSRGSCYIAKLLGTYERELHEAVEDIIFAHPSVIIDLGAAEGYYAVGMARRLEEARVIAFEMDDRARDALAEMAQLNGVFPRVEIRGKCEACDLAECVDGVLRPIVICDVEGHERELLDPARVPALAGCTILVELHDFVVPGLCEELVGRFMQTHTIKRIWQAERNISEFPWRTVGTFLMPREYLQWAVNEWRPVRMSWLYLVPIDATKQS